MGRILPPTAKHVPEGQRPRGSHVPRVSISQTVRCPHFADKASVQQGESLSVGGGSRVVLHKGKGAVSGDREGALPPRATLCHCALCILIHQRPHQAAAGLPPLRKEPRQGLG